MQRYEQYKYTSAEEPSPPPSARADEPWKGLSATLRTQISTRDKETRHLTFLSWWMDTRLKDFELRISYFFAIKEIYVFKLPAADAVSGGR